ncbi:hypothetical protein E2C01_065131 [Portunus trituberculatus]|uniref:Uncharacterized protein n=1 Tax=Portunus trituberculatus TaxID=210409 RepID=A0A5B7HM71_PORTR|nr:hypothetical protein [Portunus trituberculatus]
MYKIVNGIEKIDKEDLVLVTEAGRTRGHAKTIREFEMVSGVCQRGTTGEEWSGGSGMENDILDSLEDLG